ncbi:MAG: dynamin family protein [Planctomycetota bacterium]
MEVDGELVVDLGDGEGAGVETSVAPQPPMRTIQKQFCEEFDQAVRPILGPLSQAAESLDSAPSDIPVREVLPRLHDLNHQMQVLIDKVEQQHAYVLIFGPLKSGKSTFMNAMCSAYVSEVTCLPAYPCMVFVSNGDEPSSVVTHYNGSTSTYGNDGSLHQVVEDAHIQLTDTIRRVEAQGERFDPAQHLPQAIRKVDVKLPAGDLAESGAMLVDTPGLYSRMRFGYDQMTRDFRDAAACAIFIVKTDNLFLEQVFDEFEELLGLFSRIFLIVNLDTNKKDLGPDGQLSPSLESDDPQRIIKAFKDLSMSAALRAASDEGRLVICPVDLLSAASKRIVRKAEMGSGEGAAVVSEPDDFDALQTELTDYLNSNEYLKAFLVDSLRRANTLLTELSDLAKDPAVKALEGEVEELRRQHDEASAKAEAIQRLNSVDLGKFAKPLREALERRGIDYAKAAKVETGHTLSGAIDGWFDHDGSLKNLNTHSITPTLVKTRNQYHEFLRDELGRQTDNPKGGLTVYQSAVDDYASIGIDFAVVGREAFGRVTVTEEGEAFEPTLTTEGIPVKKSFWDWILFRSRQSVRKRVLGPADDPDHVIQPPVKNKRLGDPAKRAMQSMATKHLELILGESALKIPDAVTDQYLDTFTNLLTGQVETLEAENTRLLEDLSSRLSIHEEILNRITSMALEVEQTSKDVDELNEHYGEPFEAVEVAEESPAEKPLVEEDGGEDVLGFVGDDRLDEEAGFEIEVEVDEDDSELRVEDLDFESTPEGDDIALAEDETPENTEPEIEEEGDSESI